VVRSTAVATGWRWQRSCWKAILFIDLTGVDQYRGATQCGSAR
jgi:hypothetical protein